MVVILIVAIGSQPIFLVVSRVAWNPLVGMDCFNVSTNGLLLLDRR